MQNKPNFAVFRTENAGRGERRTQFRMGRKDVDYEDFHGHKLDRKLLRLLQEFA